MKSLCIYHKADLDGWVSGAIVIKRFKENSKEYNRVCYIKPYNDLLSVGSNSDNADELFMLGYNYGDPIPIYKGFDKVIMVDCSFPIEIMEDLYKTYKSNFIWIDHHEIIERFTKATGLQNQKLAACELTWLYYYPKTNMPDPVRYIGRYDNLRDNALLKITHGKRMRMFQYYANAKATDCFDVPSWWLSSYVNDIRVTISINTGMEIYNGKCIEAKNIFNRSFPVKLFWEDKNRNLKSAKMLCLNQCRFNPINYNIDYHKEGYDGFMCYWYEGGSWRFSMYNDNNKVNCAEVCKFLGGGGHPYAAGFVLGEKIDIFINKITRNEKS
jgi:hypothetical protein